MLKDLPLATENKTVGDISIGALLPTEAPWLLCDYADSIWSIADSNKQTVKLIFDVPLPDGSRLTDPVNESICNTIKRATFELRTGPLATSDDGGAQVFLCQNLRNLAAWMILNGIFKFSQLSFEDIDQHVKDRAKGIEYCLDISSRIQNVLDQFEQFPNQLPSTARIFEQAGCFGNGARFPLALQKIENFRLKHGLILALRRSINERLSYSGMTHASIITLCLSISRLWTLSSRLDGGGLEFNPFPDGVKTIAENFGRADARTKTPPKIQTLDLVEKACQWVSKTGPKLLDLRDELTQLDVEFPSREKPSGNQIRTRESVQADIFSSFNEEVVGNFFPRELIRSRLTSSDENTVLMRRAINGFLPTACAIVIAAFTARRHMEVLMLEDDAIFGNEFDGYWINSFIEKSLRKFDKTPCPPIVVKAVELLERWSRPARLRTGKPMIFQIPTNSEAQFASLKFRIGEPLDALTKFLNVPKLPDGTHWHFAPHQFRRFFAIMYVWHYDFADLGALSHHFRHFNIEMTRRYVTDAEMGRTVHEEQRIYTIDKMMAIAQGDSNVGGAMGKRMERHVARLRKNIVITSERNLKRNLEQHVDELGLTLRGTPWGYCGCRNTISSLRRANCQKADWKGGSLTADGFPDVGGSSEVTCIGCIHNMVDRLREPHWRREIARIESALSNSAVPPIAAAAMKKRKESLEAFVENSFGGKNIE